MGSTLGLQTERGTGTGTDEDEAPWTLTFLGADAGGRGRIRFGATETEIVFFEEEGPGFSDFSNIFFKGAVRIGGGTLLVLVELVAVFVLGLVVLVGSEDLILIPSLSSLEVESRSLLDLGLIGFLGFVLGLKSESDLSASSDEELRALLFVLLALLLGTGGLYSSSLERMSGTGSGASTSSSSSSVSVSSSEDDSLSITTAFFFTGEGKGRVGVGVIVMVITFLFLGRGPVNFIFGPFLLETNGRDFCGESGTGVGTTGFVLTRALYSGIQSTSLIIRVGSFGGVTLKEGGR
jgi:hypothetical protein